MNVFALAFAYLQLSFRFPANAIERENHMRRINDTSDLRVSFAGIVFGTGATAKTHYGYAIDTLGFSEVLGMITMGCAWATAPSYTVIGVRFQESALLAGTGSAWSDITDGAPCGSFDISDITVATVSASTPMQQNYGGVEYMQLADGNRKRYIRPIITVTGVAGSSPTYVPVTVSVLLGGAQRSTLVQNASSFGTSTRELSGGYGNVWGTNVNAL